MRHQTAEFRRGSDDLKDYNNERVLLIGAVSKEPGAKESNTKLVIKAEQLIIGGKELPIFGEILVTTKKYPEYRYGDKLKITGNLEIPPVFEGFNYANYLQKEGIYSIMSWPQIELLSRNSGNPLVGALLSFKSKFQEVVRTFISPPQEGILEALIFGEEDNISQNWKDKLNITGTRHIAAVSGMNITIIASLILSFALSLGLWRQQAVFLSIFLLMLYISMIGFPASAVRAGIMGALLLIAQHFGRATAAQRIVFFTASFMLFLNPLLLVFDIGFQLSFLAILGLIYLQPIFHRFFKKIPDSKFLPLKTTLSATLAAQIFTLPILIYNFGRISVFSLIPNIRIVPALARITVLIIIFGISGIIFLPLGYIFSFPTWFFLTYIINIIDWFSKIPLINITLKIHWIWLLIFYSVLILITWRLNKNKKPIFLNN